MTATWHSGRNQGHRTHPHHFAGAFAGRILLTCVLLASCVVSEHGAKAQARRIELADFAKVVAVSDPQIAPDGKSYAYCYARLLSDLFVVEGLK